MTTRHRILPILLAFLLAGGRLIATPFVMANFDVNDDASLRAAIVTAADGDSITFTADITLTADLPLVQKGVTIIGNNHTLSGNNQFRGFFVANFNGGSTLTAVSVTIHDLTITNARARGGTGGSSGGGGAGLGGGLFVADQAALTVNNVSLTGNSAAGGVGGGPVGSVGGGGGMGGTGGTTVGGGGGLGAGATGGNNFAAGQAGIATGATAGGTGGSGAGGGSAGGVGGGGGGGATAAAGGGSAAGGGVGGANGVAGGGDGGAGGFGGGGGGTNTGVGTSAGAGGFGGGGGNGFIGGAGGFGGGGGGGVIGGAGGFGGGAGSNGIGGGGGAGLGGAVFVQQGGTLTFGGPFTVNGNTVTAGAAGGGVATAGSAFGKGIFLQGTGATLTFQPGASQTQTMSDAITDQTGSGGNGSNGITKSGAGTLVLGGANTYTGATRINGGTLRITGSTSASSAVTVGNGGTLDGSGTVGGSVTVNSGGTLAPGNSPGIINTGALTLNSGSTLSIELNGTTAGTGYDQVNVTGAVNLTGATLSIPSIGYLAAIGDSFIIVKNDGADAVTGTFSGLAEGAKFTVGAGAYRFQITYAGGDGNDVVLTSVRLAQSITFNPLANKAVGDPAFGVSASASSLLAVSFSSLTTGVCAVAPGTPSTATVTIVTGGLCTLEATQTGSPTYEPASPVTRSFSIGTLDQTIGFAALSAHTFGDAPFAIGATASSGLAVTFTTLTPSVCTVSGGTVAMVTAGTCTIAADQDGDSQYSAAARVTRSFTVAPATQTITFAALPGRTLGEAPLALGATASSGLTVTFSSLTSGVCTVTGATTTLVAAGTCTIAADQVGNANYSAAPQVTRSFTVTSGCSAITPAQLPVALIGLPYTQTLTLGNAVGLVTWSMTGTLPAGVTFDNGVMAGTPSTRGAYPVSVTGTDAAGCQATASYTLAISPERRLLVGAGPGASTVRAFNLGSGTARIDLDAFGGFSGGVSVAQGDTDGNGVPDAVVGAGPGAGPAIAVFDGVRNSARLSFLAFDASFRGGVDVAAGDITGDGIPEILAAPQGCAASPLVRAFDGRTGVLVREYPIAAPSSTCGLHVAAGDVNGDGVAEIIVGSGGEGTPFAQIVDGSTGATLRQITPYATGFLGGVYVAAGDVNGDGFADVVTGAGYGGSPHVRVFDGTSGAQIAGPLGSFLAYPSGFLGGVRVGAGDLNGDGRADVITGAGFGGGPHVRVFDGAAATEIFGLFAFAPTAVGGTFVAGPAPAARMVIDMPATGATVSGGSVRIAGWALRDAAANAVGTDLIHAWAVPVGGGAPRFVGASTGRTARPDVAAYFGGEFLMSGFDFTGTLAAGTYDLIVFARNSRTGRFDQARVVRITVP